MSAGRKITTSDQENGGGPAIVASWSFPTAGFLFYTFTYLLGYAINLPSLSLIGAVFLMLSVIVGGAVVVRKDVSILISAMMVFVIVFSSLLNIELLMRLDSGSISYLVKYLFVFLLYILIHSNNLPPLGSSAKERWFMSACLFVVLVSLMINNTQALDFSVRQSGVFANPNSFALFTLSVLLFVNPKDSVYLKVFYHTLVVYSLLVASGSAAILAYVIGMAYKQSMGRESQRIYYLFLFILVVCVAIYASLLFQWTSIQGVFEKLSILYEYFPVITGGQSIDYGELYAQYGSAVLSGIWRLDHWWKLLEYYYSGNSLQLLFGFGAGSSKEALALLPHNDYLRFLYELGLVGLSLLLAFYITLFRTIDKRYKPVLLMFLVYSFTDNNFDNFLFMSVFVLVLASSQKAANILQRGGDQ